MDGFSISNIEWSDKVGATKVTVAKDGQFATITFNQALLSQAAPGQNPVAQQPQQPQQVVQPASVVSSAMPNQGVPQANFPKPMPVPSLPTPPPRVRGVIPRNPSVPATTSANTTPAPEL
jgi:hypothetical protein